MNYAYLLLPLLGLLWALVVIIISEAKQNGIKPQHFYLTGSLCSSMLLFLLNLFSNEGANIGKDKLCAIVFYMLAAFFNGAGQALSMSNLKKQGRALAYSIPLLAFLLPFITIVLEMHGIQNVNIQYCLGFSGGVYGIYIILGYLVKKGRFKKYKSRNLGLLAVVSFIICVLFQYYAFIKGYNFVLWYEFPFVLIGSFTLFELCSRIEKVRAFSLVSFLSKYSFAVFLVHNLFRLPLLPVVVDLPYSKPVKAIILWILLIILSYIAVVIIYRIPKIGRYILYM
ncbi:MAG: acyltransferase family protein [Victivallales bacterium]|nr:acyltransferase family protein [Victivallales bacterium]